MTLLILALAWLGGLITAALGGGYLWPLALAAGFGLGLGLLIYRERGLAVLALACVALVLAAMVEYDNAYPSSKPNGIALENGGQKITFAGTVITEPEQRGRTQRFQLEVADAPGARGSEGKVLVTTRPFPHFHYGDRLTLTAKLATPPALAGFDYRNYLARQGVVSLASFPTIKRLGGGGGTAIERTLWRIRRPLAAALERALPEPEAALAEGMVLGLRSSIPRDLTDDFNTAGVSHIIAISGYNVTLVAGLSLACLAWPLGRRRATLAAMAAVLLFVLLVGPTPSVLRAGVMGIVMLGATLAGRPGSLPTSIAASAAVLTALSPLAIDDVGFQLSFAATLGLVFVAQPLEVLLTRALGRLLPAPAAETLSGGAAVTLAATLAAAPIIGLTFGRISLVAIPANLLAAPLVPVILVTSALTATGGAVSPALGSLLANLAQPALDGLIAVARTGASLPGASFAAGFRSWTAAAVLALGVCAAVLASRLTPVQGDSPPRRRLGLASTALVLGAIAILSWWRLLSPDDGRLHVTFLDLGPGDATLITTPAGHRILVDGGPSGPALNQALGRELGGGARLDLVVLTQPRADRVTGLAEVAGRYSIQTALLTPDESPNSGYRAFRDALDQGSVRVEVAAPGKWVDLGGGVRLEVVGPPDETAGLPADRALVLRLVHHEISFLLAGDLGPKEEKALLSAPLALKADVVELPRREVGLTSAPFVAAVRPAVVTGRLPETPGDISLAGLPVFSRDVNGTVRFQTDGRRLWAEADRGTFQIYGKSAPQP